MKLCSRLLAIFAIAFTCALTSCSGPSSYTYQNVAINLSYYPDCNGCTLGTFQYQINPTGAGGVTGAIEMPAGGGSGGCIELIAAVTNAPLNLTWTIIPTPNPTAPGAGSGTTYPPTQGGPNVGTLASANGNTNFYCEPSSIPIYTGPALVQAQAAGLVQGTTEVLVTNPADPNNPSNVVSANLKFAFQLNSPPTGINVGIFNGSSVSVPLGSTYQFTGWVAGVNGLIGASQTPAYAQNWAVSACTGSTTLQSGANYGTINATTGLYTAPAAYPSAATHCANITIASAAYPTIISAVTTVNFP